MTDDQQKKFRDYVERMKEIRLLSSPTIDEIENADDYSRILIRSFSRIGELAAENRKLIDGYIKPLLASRGKLTEETRKQLSEFNDLLLEDSSFAEIDAHLSEILNDLLLTGDEDPAGSADEDTLVILMARKVVRDYFMLSGLTQLSYHARPIVVADGKVKLSVEVTGSKSAGFRHDSEWSFLDDGSLVVSNMVVPHGTMPRRLIAWLRRRGRRNSRQERRWQ